MAHTIMAVEAGSIADQLSVRPGDALVSINGEKIVDWIDYQALTCAEEMELLVEREGELLEYTFEKDEYEPLGLTFGSQLMSRVRYCANKCIFCFVDQLPPGARDTMRFKDDDWRLSLMMGNFVTMTNVTDKELDRIIARRASPLYISVHATDPELRAYLLGMKRGADIMRMLKRLADNGLSFHAQAVLCPGVNDGPALDRTIEDLASLRPSARSLALVPVGLTKYREGLTEIAPYDRESAAAVIDQAEIWRKKLRRETGENFVHLADEFYLLARRAFPSDAAYDGYPQIENGVGLCRLLETEFEDAWRDAELSRAKPARYAIATGTSAAPFLRGLLEKYPVPGVETQVIALNNTFFGDTVTAAGLITGGDIVRRTRSVKADALLITETMLREGEDVFLDGTTLSQVRDELDMPVIPVGRTGAALLKTLCGVSEDELFSQAGVPK